MRKLYKCWIKPFKLINRIHMLTITKVKISIYLGDSLRKLNRHPEAE